MTTFIYQVHSEVAESKVFKEFDSESAAIEYAKEFIADKPYVSKVELNAEGRAKADFVDEDVVWTYQDASEDEPTFEDLVEALETAEDVVECKECFELFPKINCFKIQTGYLCPTCQHSIISKTDKEDLDSDPQAEVQPNITTSLFDVEFPDIAEYDPKSVAAPVETNPVMDAFDALIRDEYDTIAGYEKAEKLINDSDIDRKDQILDTLTHIKEEEKEHIDELIDVGPKNEQEIESSIEAFTNPTENSETANADLDEEVFKLTGEIEIDKHNNALRYARRDGVPYLYGYLMDHGELEFPVRPIKIDGDVFEFETNFCKENPGVVGLRVAYPDKNYRENLALKEEADAEARTTKLEKEDANPETIEYEEPIPEKAIPADIVCTINKGLHHAADEKANLDEDLDELSRAYMAAAEVATDKGVPQVFGYSSKLDDEFYKLDLFDCIDPDAVEAKLANLYPDFNVAYVAYPNRSLTESMEVLFEDTLEEGPLSKLKGIMTGDFTGNRHNQPIDELFDKGYRLLFGKGESETPEEFKNSTAAKFSDAEAAAKAASKQYPNAKVFIVANAIDLDKLNSLTPALKNLVDQRGQYGARIAMYTKGKVSPTFNKRDELIKAIKTIKKSDKTLDKHLQPNTDVDPRPEANNSENNSTDNSKAKPADNSEKAADTTSASPAETSAKNAETDKTQTSTDSSKEDSTDNTESQAEKEPAAPTTKKTNAGSKAASKHKQILTALTSAGLDVSKLTVPGKDGKSKKATPELIALRKELFGESLEETNSEAIEDTVICTGCNEEFARAECKNEIDLGYFCDHCAQALEDQGIEPLFVEGLDSYEVDIEGDF